MSAADLPRQFDERALETLAGFTGAVALHRERGPERATACCATFFKLYVKCESPIESRMAAFLAAACSIAHDFAPDAQVDLEGHRCDFVLYLDGIPRIVVDCDGHDFHERTKEQAARDRRIDRKLSVAGLIVARFTGHEIWRMDINSMLNEIFALMKRAKRPEGEKE